MPAVELAGELLRSWQMGEGECMRVELTEMGVWGKPVRVELAGRYEEVWLQTIGDRTEALERGHEAMQQKLLEFRPGSERAAALREALMLAPVGDVVELALAAERSRLEGEVNRERPEPVRPRRDRAAGESEAAFAARAAEHEHRCQEVELTRRARLEERLEERRRELRAMAREELAELARPRRIDIECWNEFARTCDDWVLLRAVRRVENHEEAYFADIAEVRGLHVVVKEQLRRAYRELEPEEGDELPKG
jgi:hypothetical protein